MSDDAGDAWERILDRLRTAVAGEFEILREIGSGGMAAVYLAREVALNRQVAIKVMSPALLTGKGMVERFKQEARTIAALDHRNIVTIYAVRGSEDLHFFVMKFVKGRSLEHIIRTEGPLPIPIVRGLLYMIGDGLGHAHRRGVIHRDVKPANILIDAEGNAIVTDFGIAKVAQSQSQTHSAVMLGTPAYMSPEQCYGRPATAASDQYSLGLVAYEMITGRPPFTGSQFVVMEAHTKVAPPPIRDVRQDCPPELERAVLRMLAKEPSERWPSVQHALAELGAATLLDGHPVRVAIAKLGVPVGDEHGGAETVPRPYVSSLAILAPPDWIEAGDDLTLRASARNWSGDTMPGIAIQWRTNEPEIATVDETGTVKALAPGVVSITASVEDKESSVTVQVVPRRVATVAVSAPHEAIHVGDRVQLVARLEDKTHKELKRPIAWMTSHPNIGTISEAGVFRALSPGLALAFAEADGVRGRVEIRIGPASVAMILPTTAPTGIAVGGRVVLGATVVDSLNNVLDDRPVVWSSTAPDVATITPDGMVTAIGVGEVEFTCSCEGKSGTVKLVVEERPVITDEMATDGAEAESESIPTNNGSGGASVQVLESDAEPSEPDAAPESAQGRRRQRPRRRMLFGGAALVALVLSVSFFTMDGMRTERIRRENAKRDSIERVALARRADSLRADSLEKARTDSLAKLAVVAVRVDITSSPVSKVRVGDSIQFEAVARDSIDNTLENRVRWRSSDSTVATIDSLTGLLRARKTGKVTVIARAGDHEDHDTMYVSSSGDGGIAGTSSGVVKPKVADAGKNKPIDPKTSKAADGAIAASTLPSELEVEKVFDARIRPALMSGNIKSIAPSLGRDFTNELLDSIAKVRGGKFSVRRQQFVVDTLDGAVVASFYVRLDVTLPNQPQRPVFDFIHLIAKVQGSGNQLRLTDIRQFKPKS